jgi:DNA-binding NarL/FixJ family response regulator
MRRVVEPRPTVLEQLTPRELDVLRLVVEGFANKEIARRLAITEKTVKTHVSSILQKLNVTDRTGAAVLAIRRGLVS